MGDDGRHDGNVTEGQEVNRWIKRIAVQGTQTPFLPPTRARHPELAYEGACEKAESRNSAKPKYIRASHAGMSLRAPGFIRDMRYVLQLHPCPSTKANQILYIICTCVRRREGSLSISLTIQFVHTVCSLLRDGPKLQRQVAAGLRTTTLPATMARGTRSAAGVQTSAIPLEQS